MFNKKKQCFLICGLLQFIFNSDFMKYSYFILIKFIQVIIFMLYFRKLKLYLRLLIFFFVLFFLDLKVIQSFFLDIFDIKGIKNEVEVGRVRLRKLIEVIMLQVGVF